jgi:hypothetical protein
MRKVLFSLASAFMLITIPPNVTAQKSVIQLGDDRSLEIGGWVRSEFIFNSRATVEAVDGLFSLYPIEVSPDDNGVDINGNPSVAMSSVATRFSGTFKGQKVGKATSEAYVEMDFTAKSTANSFMFRQGWIRLSWNHAQLLMGRAWHPMSTYSIPHVVNLNFGAPFFTFNRSEQARFTYLPGNFTLSATASYQGPFTSDGPKGRSDEYMRNAIIPELSIAAIYQEGDIKVGLVGNTKTLKPRKTVTGFDGITKEAKETLTTVSGQIFSEFNNGSVSIRINGSYTQNCSESYMLGGYAVTDINLLTGAEKYTPSQHLNGWISVETGDKLKYGFFAGHTKNLGTLDPVLGTFFGRGYDIASISRIAPRVYYQFPKLSIVSELEYTTAWYGTPNGADNGKVSNIAPSNNLRLLVMAVYYF